MLLFPQIIPTKGTQQVLDTFGGYHHAPRIAEGEFYDMLNLTSDDYPMLASRKKRGKVCAISNPAGLLGGEKLVWVDATKIYYDFEEVTGLVVSDEDWMYPKYMVRMGAYVCVFPDKVYFNTEDLSDFGSMEARFSARQAVGVSYSLCKRDGSAYGSTPTASTQAPANPVNGSLWVDTAEYPHTLKQYSGASGTWVSIPTVYVRIAYPGIGAGFQKYDGVRISGLTDPPEPMHWRASGLQDGEKLLYDCGENYIVIAGMLDRAYTAQSDLLTVERVVPDMDFVVECQNRLWGCKYGEVDGKQVNELYCCALGDFKNWSQFLGLSTDSWRASCGTGGAFTGAVTLGDNPIFFKKDGLHKLFPAADGAHTVTQNGCSGVSDRQECNSLAIVGETLFYCSEDGVMAYDGTLPRRVGDALGTEKLTAVCAAAQGEKYYLCCYDGAHKYRLLVFDAAKGLWHREDAAEFSWMVNAEHRIFAIETKSTQSILHCLTDAGYRRVSEKEGAISWSAESGTVGYHSVGNKYVGRFAIRMTLPVGSCADLYLEYDSSGSWEHRGHLSGRGTASFTVPVRPRRCDHFRWKLCGTGEVRVFSVAKYMQQGSDVR